MKFSYLFFFPRDVITLQLTHLHKQKAAENFRAAMGYPQRRLTRVRAQQTQAQQAFTQGKLKIAGNMALAMKLNLLQAKPQSKL